MTSRQPPPTIIEAAPLFAYPESRELERLKDRRDELGERIRRLAPRAHYRIVLEHERKRVVCDILRLEARLYAPARRRP